MRLAVLTSGGDSPGMNAAIRSVVRTALVHGVEPVGVEGGYGGLIEGKFVPLSSRAVAGILQQGGTFLGTARSNEFRTIQGQQKALENLFDRKMNCLVVVGGNGSLAGALALQDRGVKVAGIPATIDNDVWGTDYSIGADTALNTALLAIDRIKDTASSHHRAHVIEVMGRKCGYLALASGIAGGAEAVLIPELATDLRSIIGALWASLREGKRHFIVVVAEGSEVSAREVHDYIQRESQLLTRTPLSWYPGRSQFIQGQSPPYAGSTIMTNTVGSSPTASC